jgi:hypothetical protein
MPKNLFLCLFILYLFISCESKKSLDLGFVQKEEEKKNCKILSNTRSDNQQYQFVFKDNKLVNMYGFNDFDTFFYSGSNLNRAIHSRNPNAEILFEFDNKQLLKKVIFQGKDSQGKTFSFPTTITHNVINKIESLTLTWPTFDGKLETKFSYDAAGNIKLISAFIDYEWQTILENTSFDDKNSPYKNQKLGQILSFYMVYSLLNGGNNFSYYMNNNNVKTAVVKNGSTRIFYQYDYVYNPQGYPTEMNYTRTVNNRVTPASEKFSYDCDK